MNSYGVSHKGYVRKENEDAYYIEDQSIGMLDNLYVIADGMGGHRGGAVASKMAVDNIFNFVQKTTGTTKEIVEKSVRNANTSIFTRAIDDHAFFGMGTTIEVVTVKEHTVLIAHVGDSRVYMYTEGTLSQVTKDHSYVQELVDAGVITDEEALTHPNKNRITRALGVDNEIEVDIVELQRTQADMILLLCSDGLTNMITFPWMISILENQTSLKEKVETLLEEALKNGGTDNITVVLIEVKGSV